MGVALVICGGWWDIALIVTLSVAIFLKTSALLDIQVLRYAQTLCLQREARQSWFLKEASSEELTLDVQTKVHSFNSKQNDSTK